MRTLQIETVERKTRIVNEGGDVASHFGISKGLGVIQVGVKGASVL